MSNIYLHKLDDFVETVLIPEYTRGGRRRQSADYARVTRGDRDRARRRGDRDRHASCASSCAACPAGTRMIRVTGGCATAATPTTTLLGFTGPKAEAEEIKQRLAAFLRDDLKLELSPGQDADHARPHPGGEIPRLRDHRAAQRLQGHPGYRRANGTVSLRVPATVIKAKMRPVPRRAANPRDGPA